MFGRWWTRRKGPGTSEDSFRTLAVAESAPGAERDPRQPTPEDEALLDRIAGAVVRWGMEVPAIFLLESAKPLSFVGGQFLHFLSPIVNSVVNAQDMDRLAILLERRETVEELILRIERADARNAPAKTSAKASQGTEPGR
ncbi:hypothetical protein K8I85_02780 [bacterium]|nr:hypothetical protein [bacterium]